MLEKPIKPTEVSVGNRIDLAVVPLTALNTRTRDLLTELLNHKRIFTSEDGYFRDWRGLLDIAGIPKNYHPLVSSNPNPTRRLLELWQSEADQCKRDANLAELQCALGCIDRWDVLDDTSKMFEQDAEQYLLREQKRTARREADVNEPSRLSADCDIITKHDTSDHKQQYDAFILYADADIEFATKMVERLEARGMLLCLKDRDILGGSHFEHEVISRLITERCRRVVVIISKAFLDSPLNDFTVTFAQALQIEKKERKVIPCVYDRCELPPHLRYTCRLDYQRSQNLYNFWDKLADSIRDTPRKVGVEMNVRQGDEPQKMETHSKAVVKIAPVPVPKVIVDEPTLVVKLPTAMDQESRTGGLKKSHSFWDLFPSFSHKKDKLFSSSNSQLNINEIAPSSSPKKTGSSPMALIRGNKKQPPVASASSAPSECPLGQQPEKPVKSKKKWYKPSSRKVATAV